MTLPTVKIETAPNPVVSVIWMHGLGADGDDFVPVVNQLNLKNCPPIRFVFPSAPRIPVTINGGFIMPAWYDIRTDIHAMDISKREDEAGIRKSQVAIEELIEIEKTRGAQKIVLAGFSQGCAMTLHVGLRQSTPLAGLLCLSGYLPLAEKLAVEHHPATLTTPIFLAHGAMDQAVPIKRAEHSRNVLTQLGYQVEWHEYPMEHTVSDLEIIGMSNWFRRVLR